MKGHWTPTGAEPMVQWMDIYIIIAIKTYEYYNINIKAGAQANQKNLYRRSGDLGGYIFIQFGF